MKSVSDLRKTTINGSLVVGISQVVKISVQLISIVILSRLLEPDDFGIVAATWPIIAFVGLFQEFGLQQAIIQKKSINDNQLNRIFWITCIVGFVALLVISLVSQSVANFYGDNRLYPVILFMSTFVLFGSIQTLPSGLLNRNLKFTSIAIIESLAAVIGLLSAIVLALLNFSYWSLIYSSFLSIIFTFIAYWWLAKWLPSKPDFKIDKSLLSFGANLTGFNFANYFARNLDNILIGKFDSTANLGYYDRAYKILLFPLQSISYPLSKVMIPILSKLQDDTIEFNKIFYDVISILAVVTIPGVAALCITSNYFIIVLFGEKWAASAPIFTWLAIAGLTQPIVSSFGWVFISQGRTKAMFYSGLITSVITSLAFIAGLKGGVVGIAAAYAVSFVCFNLPISTYIAVKYTSITFKIPAILYFAAFITLLLLKVICYLLAFENSISNTYLYIAIIVVISYLIFINILLLFTDTRSIIIRLINKFKTTVQYYAYK